MQNDDCGVDDLDGAKDAYIQAKRLSLLIAKGKTIATSTAANTIDKSVQSVLLVEGASSDTGIPEDRGHSEWSPNDDELLAAGKVQFPSGCAHRWRDIAQLEGKNAEACRSRVRSEAFIKVHLYPGEKKEDKLEGDVRTATTPPVLDDSRERVVASEGLKVEAEDRGSIVDSGGAPQDEFDYYCGTPYNLAALFDKRGMQNYASLTRWLDDHNNLSGLCIVAREGLDKDAEDHAASFIKLSRTTSVRGSMSDTPLCGTTQSTPPARGKGRHTDRDSCSLIPTCSCRIPYKTNELSSSRFELRGRSLPPAAEVLWCIMST